MLLYTRNRNDNNTIDYMSVRRNIIIKIYKQDLLLLLGKRNRMIVIIITRGKLEMERNENKMYLRHTL